MLSEHFIKWKFESRSTDVGTEAQRDEETYTGESGTFFCFTSLGVGGKKASEARVSSSLDQKMPGTPM